MSKETQISYGAGTGPSLDEATLREIRLTVALAWVGARRTRDNFFDPDLFTNPVWDVLLDLYVSHAKGRTECLSSVCVASNSPTTTVARWIGTLVNRGLIERAADPNDRRRTLLNLSAAGLKAMELTLDAAAQSDARLGIGRMTFCGKG